MTDSKKRVFTVLCIDGGGVRGLIPVRILEEIEKITGKPIAQLFDMIGGPSTGGIVSAGLCVPDPNDPTKPKYSAAEMKDFYYTDAPKIFPDKRFKDIIRFSSGFIYDPKPLEEALLKKFGDTRLKDAVTSLVIPVTQIKPLRHIWLKHVMGEKDNSEENWSSILMRDAVRATTTAPTYFPATWTNSTPNDAMPDVQHRHALIDGGLFAGNFLNHMLVEARRIAPPDSEILLVHVGTGTREISISPEEWNRMGTLGLFTKNVLMSLFINLPGMASVEDMKAELGDSCISLDAKIRPPEDPKAPKLEMDDSRPETLKKLEEAAEEIIAENKTDIERLCKIALTRSVEREKENAFRSLALKMKEQRNEKKLTHLYNKILECINNIDDGKEQEIKRLTRLLTKEDKTELYRLYNVMKDELENKKLIDKFKDIASDAGDLLKKALGPEDKKPPELPPTNDAGGTDSGNKPSFPAGNDNAPSSGGMADTKPCKTQKMKIRRGFQP